MTCKTTCGGTQNLRVDARRAGIDTLLSGDVQRIFGLSHFADSVLMTRLLRFCAALHIDVGFRS